MKELFCVSCEGPLAGEGPFFCINKECPRHGLLTVVFKKLVKVKKKKKKTVLRGKKKTKKKRVKSKRKAV